MAQKLSASRISPEPVTLDVLNSGLQTKQNKLIAGTGIQIENDTISSTVNSAEWGNITGDITQQTDLIEKLAESGGSGKADNITITKNEADELQAEGCLNQLNNTTPIKFWSGTKAEYDAIKIKDDDTLYNVDEDSSTIHSGDDEVITGIKTFDGQEQRQSITITNDLVDINTESETQSYSSIYFTDKKTSKVIGDIASATTKYNTGMLMACENPYNLTPSETIKQESLYPQLGIYSYPDGTYSSVAPEPVESSNDQNIATTSFVNKTVDKKVGNEINSNLLNYTTNRILEIPQDTKLELNNGTLTLKAGSKVYVPNEFEADGTTPKFDVVTIENDVQLLSSLISTYLDGDYSWCYNKDLNKIQGGNNKYKQIQSQTYDSSADYCMFYDTTNNIIKYTTDAGATWESGYSLPFCLSQLKSGKGLTSIDQIFDGFGYIGSTLFALPDVKCLAANGIDNIGRALSNNYVTNNVLIRTIAKTAYDTTCVLDCANNALTTRYNFVISDTPTTGLNGVCRYTPTYNQYIYDENTIHSSVALFDFKANDNGEITSITSHCCSTFVTGDAINFNNSGRTLLSSLGMPSRKYINLTLGASGTRYTAPANGWFEFGSGDEGAVQLVNTANDTGMTSSTQMFEARTFVPVVKGDVVICNYTARPTTYKFIYAQGDQ